MLSFHLHPCPNTTRKPTLNHTPPSRREGDSNPRIPNGINGFRDRPIRPLWHLSEEGVGHMYTHAQIPHANSHSNPHLLRGERGIRTPGPLQVNGFQDRRNRPLCHLSTGKSTINLKITKAVNLGWKGFGTRYWVLCFGFRFFIPDAGMQNFSFFILHFSFSATFI